MMKALNTIKSRLLASVAVPLALSMGVAMVPSQAMAAEPVDTASTSIVSQVTDSLTPRDVREIADTAWENGDYEGAGILTEYAFSMHDGTAGNGFQSRNWATTIAKKAVIKLLRWGGSKLPAKIAPWAGRIADFLEATGVWTHAAIVSGLMQLGIPYDIAEYTATWVDLFL